MILLTFSNFKGSWVWSGIPELKILNPLTASIIVPRFTHRSDKIFVNQPVRATSQPRVGINLHSVQSILNVNRSDSLFANERAFSLSYLFLSWIGQAPYVKYFHHLNARPKLTELRVSWRQTWARQWLMAYDSWLRSMKAMKRRLYGINLVQWKILILHKITVN